MLYFVALISGSPLKEEIHNWKTAISREYQSSRALNSPPHITLINPFNLKEENRGQLYSFLMEFSENRESFEVYLDGVSHFGQSVIFIDVIKNKDLLHLQSALEQYARHEQDLFKYNYPEREFHPHITLAFKDLTKENFRKAYGDLKDNEFKRSFIAQTIALLKHNGKSWEIDAVFSFKNP